MGKHSTRSNTTAMHGIAKYTVANAAALASATATALEVADKAVWLQADNGRLWVPRSTTAGDFADFHLDANPVDTISWSSDFVNAPSATVPDLGGFIAVAGGTGAAWTQPVGANTGATVGTWRWALGTGAASQLIAWAAAGSGATGTGRAIQLAAADGFYFQCRHSIATLSVTAQKFRVDMGITEIPGTTGPNSGVFFSADSDANTAYTMHVMNNGTDTTAVATGVTIVAGQMDHLEIWKLATESLVHFAVNGVECPNSPLATTNLPTARFCVPQVAVQRLAGVTTGLLGDLDFCAGKYKYTTPRAARVPQVRL